jgi:uncharacterized phage infection (PIP) family protein YhgE
MGSKSLETRENQKSRYAGLVESRSLALREKGLSDAQLAKDPKISHYRAKIKQINQAISRIAAIEEQSRKLLEKKEQKIAEAAAARAAIIAGESVKAKKTAEKKGAPPTQKKGAPQAKGPASAKQQPKKKGK